MEDYHRLYNERAALEKVWRDALAYCIECRNPLLATEHGFQFCPYERAGQHPKVKAALRKANLSVVRSRAEIDQLETEAPPPMVRRVR